MRFGLVRTAMVVPTDAYDGPPRAVARAGRGAGGPGAGGPSGDRRPLAGRVGEVLNLLAPRLMDAAMAAMNARMPDSSAARAHVVPTRQTG